MVPTIPQSTQLRTRQAPRDAARAVHALFFTPASPTPATLLAAPTPLLPS